MAQTLKGKGVVWGVAGLTFTGIVTSSLSRLQTADYTRDGSWSALENESGEVEGGAFYNEKSQIDVSVIPSAASIATAKANLDLMLVPPGTAVTVVDTDSTIVDGAAVSNTGKYMVSEKGCKLRRTNKGLAVVDMSLISYANSDVTGTAT